MTDFILKYEHTIDNIVEQLYNLLDDLLDRYDNVLSFEKTDNGYITSNYSQIIKIIKQDNHIILIDTNYDEKELAQLSVSELIDLINEIAASDLFS